MPDVLTIKLSSFSKICNMFLRNCNGLGLGIFRSVFFFPKSTVSLVSHFLQILFPYCGIVLKTPPGFLPLYNSF